MGYNNYRYIFCKCGIFYFNRRVPKSLQDYYVKPKIVLSLQTKSPHAANQRARQLAQKLDEQWDLLKWRDLDNILSRFAIKQPTQSNAPTLSQAAQIYLQQKGMNRPKTFESAVNRCVRDFIRVAKDKPIDVYNRDDVNQFRDHALGRGLSPSSLMRNLNTLRALTNFSAREKGVPALSTFTAVHIANRAA